MSDDRDKAVALLSYATRPAQPKPSSAVILINFGLVATHSFVSCQASATIAMCGSLLTALAIAFGIAAPSDIRKIVVLLLAVVAWVAHSMFAH